jgi:transposase
MNTKLHAVTDAEGRPLSFFMTAGQVSDYTGAAALLDDLPKAQWMLGDRGYDADWYRDALHSGPKIPEHRHQIRQAPLPKPEPYRDYVRPSEGLASRRHTLRSMPDRLLFCHRPRRNRHLLALINES